MPEMQRVIIGNSNIPVWDPPRGWEKFEHPLSKRIGLGSAYDLVMVGEALRTMADQLEGLLAQYEAVARRQPNIDPKITDKRKIDLLREAEDERKLEPLREIASKTLAVCGKIVGSYTTSIEVTEADALAVTEPSTVSAEAAILRELQLREARDLLRAMDQDHRLFQAQREAIDHENLALLWGLMGSPSQLVDREALEQMRREVAYSKFPWLETKLKDLNTIRNAAADLARGAYYELIAVLQQNHIRDEAGKLFDDWQQARGIVPPWEAFLGETQTQTKG